MNIESAPDRAKIGDRRRQAAHGPKPERPGRDSTCAYIAGTRAKAIYAKPSQACRRRYSSSASKHVSRSGRFPGYTHLQRGQPVLCCAPSSAGLSSKCWSVTRNGSADCHKRDQCDAPRVRRAGRIDDRARPQAGGGGSWVFPRVSARTAMDAVSDRDFIAELLFVLAR